jgi:cation/acetate symporter
MIIVLFYALGRYERDYVYTSAQYCIICFHGSCYLYFYQMTGNPVPQLGMGAVLGSDTYLWINGLSTDLGFSVYTVRKSMVDVFAITLALMVGTAGLPRNCSFSRLKE